jgi:hypothetical protein
MEDGDFSPTVPRAVAKLRKGLKKRPLQVMV